MGKEESFFSGGHHGSSSSSGLKKRNGDHHDDDDDDGLAPLPLWHLSLGSIYSGGTPAPSSSTATLPLEAPLDVAAPVAQRRSDVPMLPLFPPHVPDAAGTAAAGFVAANTRVQIGSSLPPGNGAAAASPNLTVQLAPSPLPVRSFRPNNNNLAGTALPASRQARTRLLGAVPASSPPSPAGPHRFRRAVRRRTSNDAPAPPQPPAVILNSADPPLPPPNNNDNDDDNNGVHAAGPPFPWATSRVGIHRSISELAELGITTIEGDVQCRRCEARKTVSYDIASKFLEVRAFVARHIDDMNDRAPGPWLSPAMADCAGCGQRGSVRAVIPPEKHRINWLFLVLGQALGLCTLEQLKHLCNHAKKHRTGAKDRVLYLAYMELLNQLCPDKLFNLTSDRQKRTQQYC